MNIKKILQTIFSIKNVKNHKQVEVFGIKFKLKRKKEKPVLNPPIINEDISNYIYTESYKECRNIGASIRNDWSYSMDITGQISYHILNKIKEIDLKRKIREGKKVNVCFLLDTPAKFSVNSIYHFMEKSSLFIPFIVLGCTDEADFSEDAVWNRHLQELELLKKNGYKVFSLYDEQRNQIPLETFKPDIIFHSTPYLEYLFPRMLSNIYLNVNYLICFINYGFMTPNLYTYYYNNRRINTAWKNFVLSKDDYIEYLKYSKDCGINAILSGYPKLDCYTKPLENCKIPEKIDNGKPIVIYAPHWSVVHSVEPNDLGTFDLYYEYFLNLVKRCPDINFVFKPHPSLGNNLHHNNIMTYEEYNLYMKKWESLPNGYCEVGGEYIDLFRKSSLMITDSCSFIAEYLPSNNPCMYLVKPSRNPQTFIDGFATSAKRILEKYYLCHNQEEIEKWFTMIMLDKQDPMYEERIKLKDRIFVNLGCAGEKIVKYLQDLLIETSEEVL